MGIVTSLGPVALDNFQPKTWIGRNNTKQYIKQKKAKKGYCCMGSTHFGFAEDSYRFLTDSLSQQEEVEFYDI